MGDLGLDFDSSDARTWEPIMPPPVRDALERAITLLVAGRLDELEQLDEGGRMKADEWRQRIREYGRILVEPPSSDLDSADVIPLKGSENEAWSVSYRLCTEQESKSDLMLELTVRYVGGDHVHIEVDDLRVA